MRISKSAALVAALFFFVACAPDIACSPRRPVRRASSLNTVCRAADRSTSSTSREAQLSMRYARLESRDAWTAVFAVAVAADQPPMLGDYSDRRHAHPLHADVPARSRPAVSRDVLAALEPRRSSPRSACPPPTPTPTTVVAQVYPSGEVIPENQLRLYVHFSAPMGMKGGLDYVHLLDEEGKEVIDPFLPLDAEFWNDDRTRYTVFFDPGRQKRGIPVIVEMGRSLTEGKSYTLVVDKEWRDGNGLPLKEIVQAHVQGRPARRASARSHGVADPGADRGHARTAHRRVSRTARSRIAAARVRRPGPGRRRDWRRHHGRSW